MVNNFFVICGTAISEFTSKKIGNYTFNYFELETEKSAGKTSIIEINVYEGNKMINLKRSIKGKYLIVSGNIDSSKPKGESRPFMRLVAQDIFIAGYNDNKNYIANQKEEPKNTDDDLPF